MSAGIDNSPGTAPAATDIEMARGRKAPNAMADPIRLKSFDEKEDGDPLDVLVLMDEPAFPGCKLKCRVVGLIEGEGTDKPPRSATTVSWQLRTRLIRA